MWVTKIVRSDGDLIHLKDNKGIWEEFMETLCGREISRYDNWRSPNSDDLDKPDCPICLAKFAETYEDNGWG